MGDVRTCTGSALLDDILAAHRARWAKWSGRNSPQLLLLPAPSPPPPPPPPLPTCQTPLEKRLADADKFKGTIPKHVMDKIKREIRDSAEQFGDVSDVPELPPEIRENGCLTIADIQRTIAWLYGLKRRDILGRRRVGGMARQRQIAMYLARMLTPRSLSEIGRRFGGRDHTTILHGVRKIAALITTDKALAAEIAVLKEMLGQ